VTEPRNGAIADADAFVEAEGTTFLAVPAWRGTAAAV
jgi:hypothetical protein